MRSGNPGKFFGIPEEIDHGARRTGGPAYPKLGQRTDVRESRKVFRESRRTRIPAYPKLGRRTDVRESRKVFRESRFSGPSLNETAYCPVRTQMPGSRARSGNLGKFSGFPGGFLRQQSTKNTYVALYRKNVLKSKLQLSYMCKIGIY